MKNTISLGLLMLVTGFVLGYLFFGYKSLNTPIESMHHSSMDLMHGMTSNLKGLTGDELDKQFLKDMVIHHQGAIDMANILIKETKREELLKMGQDIISVQSNEIDMMERWLSDWFK